jgi:CheY-specific phosphatase CheX
VEGRQRRALDGAAIWSEEAMDAARGKVRARRTAAKLASLMLGEDAATNLCTARDAPGELCNMIAGNFKAKISNLADHCLLSLPTVISGEDYSTTEPSDGFIVAVFFDGEAICVELVTQIA